MKTTGNYFSHLPRSFKPNIIKKEDYHYEIRKAKQKTGFEKENHRRFK
jgi:hypothetical protein